MSMTNLEAEIAKAKKQAAQRIAKLKKAADGEQVKLDKKVVELLREQDPDLYQRLAREAGEAFAWAHAKRSQNARRKPVTAPQVPNPENNFGFGESFGESA